MERKKIKDCILKKINGLWGDEPTEGTGITPVIKTNNLTYDGKIDFSNLAYRSISIKKLNDSYLMYGDILIEKSGGTKSHSVGYVNFFNKSDNTYVCNNFILAIRPNCCIVKPKYLFYIMKYYYENGIFSDCYNRTTGIQNLKIESYLDKKICIQPQKIQNKIIDILDGLTNVIEIKKNELILLDELIKSRFIRQVVIAC